MKAVVLSGGGSKGAYQIGVWKALKKLNIKYDLITGTSIGALNGALMVQKEYKKAINIWKKINLKILFGEDTLNSENNLEIYKMYGKQFLKNGGMNTENIEQLIKDSINIKKFYNSKINYGLTTYNLTTKTALSLEKKDIDPDKLSDYLTASAACFPAFKKKIIEKEEYVDGGYHDNLPINLAIKMGANEIIAVDLNAPGLKKAPIKKVKTIIIKPNNKLTNFLNFYEKGTINNIKFGYNDTMKVFKKLEGKQYTFKKNHLEKNINTYKQTFLHITNEILKYKKYINSFEELLKIDINLENEKIINKIQLRLLEDLGKSFQLDETKIYTYKSFNNSLKKKLKEYSLQGNKQNKEVELYKKIKDKNYNELRKYALVKPYDLLKAIYLYTICEA